MADPDVRLMLRVRDGDAVAFEQLVARYQARLIRLLDHMIGDRDQAEDLAQDVFLRVYRARDRYEPGAKFATWLFTIANNVALNARRSHARRREVNLSPSAGDQSGPLAGTRPLERMLAVSSGQIPARQIDKAETRDIVRLALEALGERQRMAVLLSKFEQLSYAEIAEAMELSPPAVKSLLSRARVNLRDVLTPYLADGHLPGGTNEPKRDRP
jgi:RNA polymerase sigma-70 factor (ECF subfamily)